MTGAVIVSPLSYMPGVPHLSQAPGALENLYQIVRRIRAGQLDVNASVVDAFPYFNDVTAKDPLLREILQNTPAIQALSWEPAKEQAEERLAVTKKLIENGYDVHVLSPTDKLCRQESEWLVESMKKAGAKPLETKEPKMKKITWCRDGEVQISDMVYLAPDLYEDWFSKLGYNGKKVRASAGEGGTIAPGSGFVLTTGVDRKSRMEFEKQGLRLYKLPEGKEIRQFYYTKGLPIEITIGGSGHHIDYFAKPLPFAPFVIVDGSYYADNKDLIEDICKKENHAPIVMSVEESKLYLPNFLSLPDDKVLINHSERLYDELKKRNLHEKAIMMDEPVIYNQNLNGCIGCFTNALKL